MPLPTKAEALDPAAHYVKGPGASCHSLHLPSWTTRVQDQKGARHKGQKTSALSSEDEKMDFYVGCGDPEEKHKLFQVKLCLVSP